jgi:hypothetical protein
MQEISNLLRERLTARPAPQNHPDPDLLTAYVEQALGERERAQVVQHLAECRDCREVVSLSMPQEEPAQVVVQPAAPARSRLWLPAFRWTAVAATIAIAATLVVEKSWKNSSDQQAQRYTNSSAPAQAPFPDKVAVATTPAATDTPLIARPTNDSQLELHNVRPSQSNTASARKDLAKPEAVATGFNQNGNGSPAGAAGGPVPLLPSPPPLAPKKVTTAAAPVQPRDDRDYLNTSFLDNKQEAQASETVETTGEAAIGGTVANSPKSLPLAPAPKSSAGSNARTAPATPPLNADNTRNAFAVSVNPPTTAQTAPQEKSENNLASQSGFAKSMGKKVANVVHTLARAGSSEKSSITSFADSSTMANISSNEADGALKSRGSMQWHWQISEGVLMKSTDETQWHKAYSSPGTELQFKTLTTVGMGNQVWAGANNGTLVHSWNAGVNWDTLKVPEAGSSDITSITIDDGWQIKTSDGQTFVSHDQGKTWVPLKQDQK